MMLQRIAFTVIFIFEVISLKLTAQDTSSSIRLLQLADWGGTDVTPFVTPSQVAASIGMAAVGLLTQSISKLCSC